MTDEEKISTYFALRIQFQKDKKARLDAVGLNWSTWKELEGWMELKFDGVHEQDGFRFNMEEIPFYLNPVETRKPFGTRKRITIHSLK